MTEKKTSEDLKLIRINDFRLIPRYLFEQAKPSDGEVDRIYGDWGRAMAQSPLSLLYAMADEEYKTKGVLWAGIDPIKEDITVQVLSLDKKYQDGKAVPHAIEFLSGVRDKLGLNKIRFMATRAKAFERFGCRKSDQILMEV
ncbi:MAG: hypothetical protein ACLFUL_07595 [Desulfobacteraceae bacterium]